MSNNDRSLANYQYINIYLKLKQISSKFKLESFFKSLAIFFWVDLRITAVKF